MTILVFGIISTGLGVKSVLKQRGYCSSTGDFSESDHMTVISKERDWFNVLAKDGRVYKFYPCPPSKMGWKAGTVIEYAKYELRDGCADFSSPLASVIAH